MLFYLGWPTEQIKEAIPLAREINKRQLRTPTAELILLVDAVAREAYSDANRLLGDFSGQGLIGYMKSMMGAWIKIGQASDIKGAIQMLSLMKDLPNFGLLYQFHVALMADVAGMTEKARRVILSSLLGRFFSQLSASFKGLGYIWSGPVKKLKQKHCMITI